MYLTTKKNKRLEELLQMAIYRSSLATWKELHQKILRMHTCRPYKQLLSADYAPSYVTEFSHYYIDCYDPSIYKVNWRPLRTEEVTLPLGTILYHLTAPRNVEKIEAEGLTPSYFSDDGLYYGANKIYLNTRPFEDENQMDPYLWNRTQVELTFDGSFQLYKDWEYDHIAENTMVYTIIDHPISNVSVSEKQPNRRNLKNPFFIG